MTQRCVLLLACSFCTQETFPGLFSVHKNIFALEVCSSYLEDNPNSSYIYMTLQLMTTYKKLTIMLEFYISLPARPPAGIFLWGISVYVFTSVFYVFLSP